MQARFALSIAVLLALAPQLAAARPYRIAAINEKAVQLLDVESLRQRPQGTVTAWITEILKRGEHYSDPRATVRQTVFEYDCKGDRLRSIAVRSMDPQMKTLESFTGEGRWLTPDAGEAETFKLVCAFAPDPKLNVEAPSLQALVGAMQVTLER